MSKELRKVGILKGYKWLWKPGLIKRFLVSRPVYNTRHTTFPVN